MHLVPSCLWKTPIRGHQAPVVEAAGDHQRGSYHPVPGGGQDRGPEVGLRDPAVSRAGRAAEGERGAAAGPQLLNSCSRARRRASCATQERGGVPAADVGAARGDPQSQHLQENQGGDEEVDGRLT